jgi:sorbose reductase
MRGRGGSVVLISSIAARSVVRPEKCAAYCATKAAVEHLAALLGVEWARDGIRVNAVGPGRTETPMIERIARQSPEMVSEWMAQVPIGRLIRPEEVANAVAFFLSDLSSGCNGTTLMVGGGYDKAWQRLHSRSLQRNFVASPGGMPFFCRLQNGKCAEALL